jgi:hypothetical protein
MRGYLRASLLLVLLLLAGCGKNYPLAPVSGRVTLDNRPLAHAEVHFAPTGGQNLPSSVGVTDDDGHYELYLGIDGTPGAIIGEHRVTISLDQRKNKALLKAGGEMTKRPGELLPSKYNRDSKLTCTVPPEGKNDANFDLKSK